MSNSVGVDWSLASPLTIKVSTLVGYAGGERGERVLAGGTGERIRCHKMESMKDDCLEAVCKNTRSSIIRQI